jgi:hypothetical protein
VAKRLALTPDQARLWASYLASEGWTFESLDLLDRERLLGLALATCQPADWTAELGAARAGLMRKSLQQQRLCTWLASAAPSACVVYKGADLARHLYPEPWQRAAADVDVLIAKDQYAAWHAWLSEQGFRALVNASSASVLPERTYVRGEDCIDLHWQLIAHPIWRAQFKYSDLVATGRQQGQLIWPNPIERLLIAVCHLLAHERGAPLRLIWLHDIVLLWRMQLDLRQTVAEANRRQLGSALAACLTAAGIKPPSELGPDTSATMLEVGGKWTELWQQLSYLPWRERCGYLRDVLVPTADYLRGHYGQAGVAGWFRHRLRKLGG